MAPNCKKWLNGTCEKGEQCRWRHGTRTTAIPVSRSFTAAETTVPPPGRPKKPERTPEENKARRINIKDRKMMKNTTCLLHTFDLATVQMSATEDTVNIKDCRFIASYNWSNSDEPVIFVPGSPAKWAPPNLPCRVRKDNGQIFIDQNSHRCPSESFDPFFKALLTMHPTFHMDPIALVTDRNSLRKLLNFASGKVPESWRIDVDLVNDTLFFTRWEEKRIQIITGSKMSGYGHEFEKTFLAFDADLKNSSGHHRIVRYNLSGIECLVRFEVDGCVDDGQKEKEDDLAEAFSDLNMQASSAFTKEVKVITKGRLVEPNSIMELKSRSANAGTRLPEIIPQLWISQTQHLFIGRHKAGLVDTEPERFDMHNHFSDWETKNNENLKVLVDLIERIKDVAKGVEGGRCVLVCKKDEKPRVLRIYERNGKGLFLPEGVKEWCWGREDGEA